MLDLLGQGQRAHEVGQVVGEGPAGGVLRIWAGDRLIADLRAGAGAYANHPKYRFRIYLGTEDQGPDPLIRRHVENSADFDGHDATPAHRGLVYIVFEDLPLDEFGNRIPPITAEIAWAGAPQAVVKDTTFLSGAAWFTNSAVLDSERGFLYFKTSPDGIGRIRTSGMVEDLRVTPTVALRPAGVTCASGRCDKGGADGRCARSRRRAPDVRGPACSPVCWSPSTAIIDLDRSTLTDWVGRSAALLEPLAEAIGRHVLGGSATLAPSAA